MTLRKIAQLTGSAPAMAAVALLLGAQSGTASAAVVAASLPASRSVQVGTPATAFGTIINTDTGAAATGCGIAPLTSVAADFSFQTTDPATNALTGTANTPVNIPAGGSQSYLFAFTPTAALVPTEVELSYDCDNTDPAPVTVGLNTLLLSASTTPVPDIVALAATVSNDGSVSLPDSLGASAFAVATVNVGAADNITASADTGSANLPLTLSVCETDPGTGGCLAAPAATVTTTIGANATPTFSIFVNGEGSVVPFDPANNRVTVRFTDGGGVTRGSTSVAVQTLGSTPTPTLSEIQNEIFTPICSGCHSSGGIASSTGLFLVDEQTSAANLINVTSSEVPSLLRVNPGDPDNSYLIQKLEGTAAVGERMPLGGNPLSQSDIDMIRQWISGGAAGAGMISGTTVKGPVNGGTVTAYRINGNGTQGAQIGTAMTDAQGNFSMQVGDYFGAVMLQLSGGQYRDEATDQLMNMDQNTVMTAAIPDMASGEMIGNIKITPITSMAQEWAQNMAGGMTQANIALANRNMGQYFDVGDPLTTHPMDPLVQGSGAGANQDQRNYGMTLAAMSQEAFELAMPNSSGIVTAMMDDASDGIMDGRMGGNNISMGGMGGMMGGIMMQSTAGTGDLASAMTTFIENTTYNRSGLTTTDMQTLIDKLNASNGNI